MPLTPPIPVSMRMPRRPPLAPARSRRLRGRERVPQSQAPRPPGAPVYAAYPADSGLYAYAAPPEALADDPGDGLVLPGEYPRREIQESHPAPEGREDGGQLAARRRGAYDRDRTRQRLHVPHVAVG